MSLAIQQASQDKRNLHRPPVPVLFIIDQLCEAGGAEKALMRMITGLPRDRFAPFAVTFKWDREVKAFESFPCPLLVYPLQKTYDSNALAVAWKIRSLIRNQGIQIVHTFHETSDIWGGMVSRLSGCPILISSRRDMGIQRLRKHTVVYRWMGRFFDQVQTVSEQVRQFCIETDGIPPARVVTIHNGIDVSSRPPTRAHTRERLGLDRASHVVLSVGHVRRVKGYDVLVQAAAVVLKEFPRAVFAIAGGVHEPACFTELQDSIRSSGLQQNFTFLGEMDDVRPALAASDLFCLPSRSEGLSNAMLEAMAAKLPCVATRVGGNPELIEHDRTGLLVESENAGALAAAICRLLRDQSLARRLGDAGQSLVLNNFTTEVMMKNLIASYESLLLERGILV